MTLERAIVVTVTKTVVHGSGELLLPEIAQSFTKASADWAGENLPAYLLFRSHGQSGISALELGDTPCDLDAITTWSHGQSGVIGRFEPGAMVIGMPRERALRFVRQ